MKYASLSDTAFAVRLDPGEDIHDSIQNFCATKNINNAGISGIGSVDSPILAHYAMTNKQFTDKRLDGIFEVTALEGNVSLVDSKPFAHVHLTMADASLQVFGGHLVKGSCSATLELIVTAYPSHHWKSDDDAIGLKVWDFDAH